MTDRTDILAFSPHPDDVEIGCGGTLILQGRRGRVCVVADLTRGECSSRGTPEIRDRERRKALEILGVKDRLSLGLPDTSIGRDPEHRIIIVNLIRRLKPRIVLAPYWADRHPDHEAAGRLIREATFYAGVQSLWDGNPYRPEWTFFYMLHSPFIPSFVVDISSVWEDRQAAVRAYKSQLFDEGAGNVATEISNPNFMKYQRAKAFYFGSLIGVDYGEPFYSPGPVPLSELPLSDPLHRGDHPRYRPY